jgi:hypothetical protein
MTTYVVLIRQTDGAWQELHTVEASSADDAIRKAADAEEGTGTFVAIPARSWKPRRVQLVATTRLKLDDAVVKDAPREEPEA